eukprot:6586668-Heterocapsa_arctica.AAC.1
MAKLEAIPCDEATGPALPAWCHPVCRYREAFHQCGLVFQSGDKSEFYLFLFALKAPMQAAFL